MRRRFLVDTNVLVYASDPDEGDKNLAAIDLLGRLAIQRAGEISTQVAVEYYDLVTRSRRGRPALRRPQDAHREVEDLLLTFECAPLTSAIMMDAMRLARLHQMRIFDAQILATARAEGIATILTEDLQSARVIEGVRYVDPFAPAFRPALIGL